jgi:hypothetical protein
MALTLGLIIGWLISTDPVHAGPRALGAEAGPVTSSEIE